MDRRLRAVTGLALLAGLVAVVGPRRLAGVLAAASPGDVGLAALAYGAGIGLRMRRWSLLLELQAVSLPARAVVRAYGLGMLLGAVTPGRLGQHAKASAVAATGARWQVAVAGTLIDQLLDLVVMAALLPVAIAYFGKAITGSLGWAVALVAATGIAGLAASRIPAVRDRWRAAAQEAVELGRRVLGRPLLLSIAATALYFLAFDLAGRAVGIEVGYIALALAAVASALVEVAPVTVAGLGTREAALLGLLAPLGVEAPSILALTLIVRALHIATGALAYLAGRPVDVVAAPEGGRGD